MANIAVRIQALLTGRPQPFREDGTLSAFARRPVHGPVMLGPDGFAGDEVADRVHHGGPDKAVHLYPHDHYGYWRTQLGDHKLLAAPGAFGENISTSGFVESAVRIGDIFRMGQALVQVSHGRKPCWKIDHRFGVSGAQSIMTRIVQTGRCGLYFRVLEPGPVAAGEMLKLIEAGPSQWTVDRVFRLLIGGGHKSEPEAVEALSRLPQLAEAWRSRAEMLAG
ncbi:MAG: MOSC domain-containing protein [Blastomonas sp.]